jgi:hypothetical protein
MIEEILRRLDLGLRAGAGVRSDALAVEEVERSGLGCVVEMCGREINLLTILLLSSANVASLEGGGSRKSVVVAAVDVPPDWIMLTLDGGSGQGVCPWGGFLLVSALW